MLFVAICLDKPDMHETHKHHDCKHGSPAALPGEHDGGITTDPVCGMKVDSRTSSHRFELDGAPYWFCSARCKEFSAESTAARAVPLTGLPSGAASAT